MSCNACSSLFHLSCAREKNINDPEHYTASLGNMGCPKCQRKAKIVMEKEKKEEKEKEKEKEK